MGPTLLETARVDAHLDWREGLENAFGPDRAAQPALTALTALLAALNWSGGPRQVLEALPYGVETFSIDDLRDALARLKLKTVPVGFHPSKLAESRFPCLYVTSAGAPMVLLGREGGALLAASESGESDAAPTPVKRLPAGQCYVIERLRDAPVSGPEASRRWLRSLVSEFRPVIRAAFLTALLVNLLSLVGPLSIMAVYDQVIAKEAVETLELLMIGVAVAATFEIALRVLRARGQAYVGAKLDYQVGGRVFEQVLHLAPTFTERAPVGGQVTRIREFDSFREVFTGPLSAIALDLPFSLLFIIVLMIVGGPIFLLPIALGLVYLIIARLVIPELRERTRQAGKARSERYAFWVELMWWMRSVKQQGGEMVWKDRFRRISADAAWANYEVQKIQSGAQSVSQSLMLIAGVATLGLGVLRVLDDAMTLGALIATMMLVWRVLAPMQTLFTLSNRLEQIRQSLRQLVDLLGYRREQEPGHSPSTAIRFRGQVSFNRVSMRFTPDANPALLGIDFTVRPGELFGIVGESGAGKSTIAKLALGLYTPQAGSVTVDGVDIRQLMPITLRQTLSYAPQRSHAFPGTLLENIRLADPTASMERVRHACRMAGLLHKIEALPDGFETRFKDGLQAGAPQGLLRQLALARAFLTDAAVYILDEPAAALDDEDERYFLRALEALRGRATVIMITQRPSHMMLCDRLLVMEQGQMRMLDEPQRVVEAMRGDLSEKYRTAPVQALAPAALARGE
ncbi:MAG: peptidase domain-containing ABC transporter [Alphaproteobacteria bacterium]|nr:peptidase domain-containing ABC transporter [Alphaproteobacteria bacterium]